MINIKKTLSWSNENAKYSNEIHSELVIYWFIDLQIINFIESNKVKFH